MRNGSPSVGAVGFEIFVETGIDLEDASEILINYRKPSGDAGSFVATPDSRSAPRDNVRYGAAYVTAAEGDLDEAGDWELQVSATVGGFIGAGKIATMTVIEALPGA